MDSDPREPSRPKIRSFYRDLIEHDRNEGTNIFNEVIQTENTLAQKAKRKKRMTRANLIWLVASLLLLVGVFVVSYLANAFRDPAPLDQGPPLPGLFSVDYNVRLSVDDTLTERLREYARQNFISPSVVRLVPEDAKILTFRETSDVLWPGMPLLLGTSVRPMFMLGYHTENNQKSSFLVLHMINLPDSIQGLRDWEESMMTDLGPAFGIPESISPSTWRDELVLNLPVRSVYRGTTREIVDVVRTPVITQVTTTTADGTTTTVPLTIFEEETVTTTQPGAEERVLFYVIVNGTFVIITDSSNTLEEIINRLAQGATDA